MLIGTHQSLYKGASNGRPRISDCIDGSCEVMIGEACMVSQYKTLQDTIHGIHPERAMLDFQRTCKMEVAIVY